LHTQTHTIIIFHVIQGFIHACTHKYRHTHTHIHIHIRTLYSIYQIDTRTYEHTTCAPHTYIYTHIILYISDRCICIRKHHKRADKHTYTRENLMYHAYIFTCVHI
jgi:hypothetical protein